MKFSIWQYILVKCIVEEKESEKKVMNNIPREFNSDSVNVAFYWIIKVVTL